LAAQLVSEAMTAGPLAGTFQAQIAVKEIGVGNNLRAQVLVKVVSNDGATVRGTLYAGDLATLTGDPTSEYATTQTNRTFPRGAPVALTSVSVQANDRVVIEVGSRKHSTVSTTATFILGETTAAGDLGSNETDSGSLTGPSPWFEFSENLFGSRGPSIRAFILE
jgi:hypothetical protein